MKRAKYVAKNPNEYKRLRQCTHYSGCDEWGFVSYRNDTPDSVKVEYRCINHVHDEKPKTVVEGKEVTVNRYKRLDNPSKLLDLTAYMARG